MVENMKIIWSDFASQMIENIYKYYKKRVNVTLAKRIKSDIFFATKQLIKHPESGQAEETLKQLNQGHRYLVEGNYKIIYKRVNQGILITDVFDTRQDPENINVETRKPI
jgi:plasmid stabilization system protein ParE